MDEEDESMKAKEAEMMDEFVANEGKEEIEEEFDLNEILMELEEGEDKKEMYEEEAEEEMEAGEAEMEAGEEAEDMGEEEIDLEDMTEDDLNIWLSGHFLGPNLFKKLYFFSSPSTSSSFSMYFSIISETTWIFFFKSAFSASLAC